MYEEMQRGPYPGRCDVPIDTIIEIAHSAVLVALTIKRERVRALRRLARVGRD